MGWKERSSGNYTQRMGRGGPVGVGGGQRRDMAKIDTAIQ